MIEIVDNTRLRDSLGCLRLYYWRHERYYVPIAPRLPLIYGSGGHATLASWYSGKTAGESLLEFEKIWEEDVIPYQNEFTEDDPKNNPVRWMEIFTVYRQHYTPEHFKVLVLPNGKLGIETPFLLPLTDDLALGGVIDLLINYLNQIMIVDHKLLTSKYYLDTNPNHQAGIYLLAANRLLKPDQPITTLLFNIIVKHPTSMKPEILFDRVPAVRSMAQLQNLEEMMTGWWNVVRENRRTGVWAQNDQHCNMYGGCAYRPLCTEVQANHRRLIPSKALYRESIWDPIWELRKHGLEETV